MTTNKSLCIIIVEKTGTLKTLTIKDYKEEELYKKCGFKKADGFDKQTEWSVKVDGQKYIVSLYAKTDGKANGENKYDFPPPVDSKLFFGSCALVTSLKNEGLINLTIALWNKIYEKLFGGFEDLVTTCAADEDEEDELSNVPAEKKTKQGYLKDGFVVDSDGDADDSVYDSDSDLDDESSEDVSDSLGNEGEDLLIQDIGSELSDEEYETDTD